MGRIDSLTGLDSGCAKGARLPFYWQFGSVRFKAALPHVSFHVAESRAGF